jgi:hypothetical protein
MDGWIDTGKDILIYRQMDGWTDEQMKEVSNS